MMRRWLGKEGGTGWTAIDSAPSGLYGVTVQAARGAKPRVIRCATLPGAELEVTALEQLSKELTVNGCPWTLPLARKEYSILVVPEPPVQASEMEQSVRWAIATMLEYPVDEASIAWMRIPTTELLPNRPPHIYVLAAQRTLINRNNALFEEAKLPLRAIDVRETAQRNIAALTEQQDEGVGLLLAGRQGVQFTITFRGELYLDRFVEEALFEGGMRDAEADGRAFERIALQVQRSLDFIHRTMPFINVGRVLVAPTPEPIDLASYIAQNISIKVETLDLADVLDITQTPELQKPGNQALYFTALGAALRFMK